MSEYYQTAVGSPSNNNTIRDKEDSFENITSSLTNNEESMTINHNELSMMEEDGTTENHNGVKDNSSLNHTTSLLDTNPIDIPVINDGENDVSNNDNNTVHVQQQDGRVLSMLNLLPRKRMREINEDEEEENSEEKSKVGKLHNSDLNITTVTEDSNVTPPPINGSSSSPPDTNSLSLARLFKKDSDHVVMLLSKALSMDSLSSLLKEEHQSNSTQLKALKQKVEKAHTVLTQCAERKQDLLSSIDKVTKELQLKRNQLAQTREELRELSMKEGHVKSNRDTAYEKCTDLRKKVHACREAIQQINNLYGKKRKTLKTSVVES